MFYSFDLDLKQGFISKFFELTADPNPSASICSGDQNPKLCVSRNKIQSQLSSNALNSSSCNHHNCGTIYFVLTAWRCLVHGPSQPQRFGEQTWLHCFHPWTSSGKHCLISIQAYNIRWVKNTNCFSLHL
jgi:hypothetical protein